MERGFARILGNRIKTQNGVKRQVTLLTRQEVRKCKRKERKKGKREKSFSCNSYHHGAAASRQSSSLGGGMFRPMLVISVLLSFVLFTSHIPRAGLLGRTPHLAVIRMPNTVSGPLCFSGLGLGAYVGVRLNFAESALHSGLQENRRKKQEASSPVA